MYFVKGWCRPVLINPSRHSPACQKRLYCLENFLRRAVDGEVRSECCDVQDTATYRGADKSLARLGGKQARKHVRDTRDFNKIEIRAVIKFIFLQGRRRRKFTLF